ncbi:MAG: hypothetical protein R2827_00955 [Bdellovibrionales bacterium]
MSKLFVFGLLLTLFCSAQAQSTVVPVNLGPLPDAWKGVTCESARFFHQETVRSLSDEMDLWDLSDLLNMTDEQSTDFLTTRFSRLQSLDQWQLDEELVPVTVSVTDLATGVDGDYAIGIRGMATGVSFLTPWQREFYQTRFNEESGLVELMVNFSDICFRPTYPIDVYSDCQMEPSTSVCWGPDCVEVVNGFHPNQCKTKKTFSIDLSRLVHQLKEIGQTIEWRGQQ